MPNGDEIVRSGEQASRPARYKEQERLLRATHGSPDSPLRFGDIEIPCYVLEDGRRVLSQGGMIRSLGLSPGGSNRRGGDRLAKFVVGQRLKPYVSSKLADRTVAPIRFRTPSGNIAYGYEATILAEICEAVLAARDASMLQKQQMRIAERCDMLIRGFARVGIIALVDEATGYQVERDRDALHRILEAYISKELLPWAKRFPDEFYQEMFRLRDWRYSPMSLKGPRYAGKLTNQLIYERLPPGVLDELRQKNPVVNDKGQRKHRHHQFLTTEIGNPHLDRQVLSVLTLMRASRTWYGFIKLFDRAFPRRIQQLDLGLEDDEDQRT